MEWQKDVLLLDKSRALIRTFLAQLVFTIRQIEKDFKIERLTKS